MGRKQSSLTFEDIKGVLLSSKHSGGKYLKLQKKAESKCCPGSQTRKDFFITSTSESDV